MPYDVICAKILVDSNRCKNSLNIIVIVAHTKFKFYKKWQTSAIICKISDSNLQTGRYNPNPGVTQISLRVASPAVITTNK